MVRGVRWVRRRQRRRSPRRACACAWKQLELTASHLRGRGNGTASCTHPSNHISIQHSITQTQKQSCDVREVLLRDSVRGRLQSLSSSGGGAPAGGKPPSPPRPRMLPKRLPGPSGGPPLGLNLLPIVQFSSESAAPCCGPPSWLLKPEPRRLNPGPSSLVGDVTGEGRTAGGRLDRQSPMESETAGAIA